MLLFCPTCGNLLMVEEGPRCYRFACNTCPYVQNIERTVGLKIIILGATTYLWLYILVGVLQISYFKKGWRCIRRSGCMEECWFYWRYTSKVDTTRLPFLFQKPVQSVATPEPISYRYKQDQLMNQWPYFTNVVVKGVVTNGESRNLVTPSYLPRWFPSLHGVSICGL